MWDRRDYPAATGIGVLGRLLGTYVLIIATVLYAGSKLKNNEGEVPPDSYTTTGIESEMTEEYIVLNCNGDIFPMEYSSYQGFKNSGENGVFLIDTRGDDKNQTYIVNENIEELGVFPSYEEATEFISSLDNQEQITR